MMGKKKLVAIRAEVRATLTPTGGAGPNPLERLLAEFQEDAQPDSTELETLFLLRDALGRGGKGRPVSRRRSKTN
jgi:hypothetical protein